MFRQYSRNTNLNTVKSLAVFACYKIMETPTFEIGDTLMILSGWIRNSEILVRFVNIATI